MEVTAAVDTVPVSREMSLSKMGLPEKNLPAVREGLINGMARKMLDLKVLD